MVLLDGRNEATLLRDGEVEMWPPEPDEVVSLVALTDARVSTDGLRWPLKNEILRAGESRGVSNEPVSNAVQVAVHTGALLVRAISPPSCSGIVGGVWRFELAHARPDAAAADGPRGPRA